MSAEDIEASKAPLMDHLIELRSRLIKALLGFGIAFIFCFFFAKQIYNVLVWPFVWVAGAENSKFIYTALLEYFITQLKLALFGAGFISFPIVATQIYKFVAPGLYKHERGAFLPYLLATPVFFVLRQAALAIPLRAMSEGSTLRVGWVGKKAGTAALPGTPPSAAPPPAANPAE